MTLKILLVGVLVVISSLQICKAQELSPDLSAHGYLLEPRFPDAEFWNIYGAVHVGLSYSDTLSRKLDFKLGLSYMSLGETYSNTDTAQFQTILSDRFRAKYFATRIGVKYWFISKRSGFYLVSDLLPHFLVSSRLMKNKLEGNEIVWYKSDRSATYHSFNVSWMNGIGYRLIVGYGISIQASIHLVSTFGNVVVGVSNSNRISRGLTLGATYKW